DARLSCLGLRVYAEGWSSARRAVSPGLSRGNGVSGSVVTVVRADGPGRLSAMSEVTRILAAIEQGDPKAAEQLLPLVYDELRKLAAQKLAQEKSGQTLEATALVHEAYLRLVGDQQFANRSHFFAAAAQAMRRILIDSARRKQLAPRVDFEGLQLTARVDDGRLLELHDALDRLAT